GERALSLLQQLAHAPSGSRGHVSILGSGGGARPNPHRAAYVLAVGEAWDQEGFRTRVQKALDAFLDEQAERMLPLGTGAARLLTEARTSGGGGEMFRAAFCWWGHQAVAPPVDEDALVRACASLELLHASALVHDDYVDASDSRRGRPSTHRTFE